MWDQKIVKVIEITFFIINISGDRIFPELHFFIILEAEKEEAAKHV